jgi:ABC-2 type transport system ATP-binding protein
LDSLILTVTSPSWDKTRAAPATGLWKTCVLLQTHQVEEIASLLTHLLFIDAGKIVLDSSMDALPDSYVDLLVAPEQVDAAMSLGPIYVRDMLGKKRMTFEGIDKARLTGLGELHVPSVGRI